jgi:predicted metal-dependent hydrolase
MKYEVIVNRKKVKYLRMRVRDGKLIVSAPFSVSNEKIEKFILDNKDFIDKALNRQQIRKEKETINYNDEITILGRKYQILEISSKSKFTEHFIFINTNEDIRKTIKKLFKKQLEEKMIALTRYYFNIMSFKCEFPSIIIKDVKSKWGSYWKDKHLIEYSSNLLFRDEITYDYLVVHELAHILQFNHSKKFYEIVNTYCPNYKQLRKLLKEG